MAKVKWSRWESNPRPLECHSNYALSLCLTADHARPQLLDKTYDWPVLSGPPRVPFGLVWTVERGENTESETASVAPGRR